MTEIQKRLFLLQDLSYGDFHSRLMPNIDRDRIIGVRVPLLRKEAKALQGTDRAKEFLNSLPHHYYEENNLHAFLVCGIGDFDECIAAVERFLPYIDNWATCDGLIPKALSKNKPVLLKKALEWLKSKHTYTARFAVLVLMRHFLDDDFDLRYAQKVACLKPGDYYVDMGAAWYFATALSKQYDAVLPLFEKRTISPWVHSKAIQKALESYRVTQEHKKYLKSLR